MGRLRKHLGDLCLQASMPGEAILHYQTSLDVLRNLNDFLWMAGNGSAIININNILVFLCLFFIFIFLMHFIIPSTQK